MLHSMTGYGKAEGIVEDKTVRVEIRSLNSKFLDLSLRLPQAYKAEEIPMRKLLTKSLHRGKVEVSIVVEDVSGFQNYALNQPLIKSYFKELSELSQDFSLPVDNLMTVIMRIPEVVQPRQQEISDNEREQIQGVVKKAIASFMQYRQHEGNDLAADLSNHIQQILTALTKVAEIAPQRITHIKNRISNNLKDIIGTDKIDSNRFEQEVIYYLEKQDINEELVRLEANCKHFLTALNADTISKGKKLGFIAQEVGREINTIGAKASNADIQIHVVHMKDSLDKVKEQIMNVM